MKVVGYIRVSTEEQAREGVSLENQEQKIRGYCDLYGHQLLEIICDAGISAKTVNHRDGLKRIVEMTDKRNCTVEGILVYSLSRIFRNARESLEYTEKWDRKGIALISVQEQLDTKSAMGKFFFTILAAITEMESNVIGERTADALKCKKRIGEKTGGDVPFGYEISSYREIVKDGRVKQVPILSVNVEEHKALTRILKLREEGHSLQALCEELESQGIKTKTGKEKWQPKTVQKILKRGLMND